jgi:hypothetical protein
MEKICTIFCVSFFRTVTDDVYKIETILKKRKRDEKFSIWSSGLDIQSTSTAGSLNRTYKSEASRFLGRVRQNMLRLDSGVRQQVSQKTGQQGRPEGTVFLTVPSSYKC